MRIARGSVAERVSFHSGYRSVAADPGIDHLEVITELRRLVLLAELRSADGAGEWSDAHEAHTALAAYRGTLTVEARVRFHLPRGYTSLPRLELQLGSSITMEPALDVHAEPIHAPGPAPPEGRPVIVGAAIEATFAAPAMRGVHTLIIQVDGVYLLVAPIDLTRMP